MPARLLLVDDEPELRRAIEVRLKASGFDVQTAGNGQEALEAIARSRPDAIVADLLMPEMDGHELICRLRGNPETAEIPVVVLTALTEAARAKWADDLAHARVLTKPFDSATLINTIRELLPHATQGGAGT